MLDLAFEVAWRSRTERAKKEKQVVFKVLPQRPQGLQHQASGLDGCGR